MLYTVNEECKICLKRHGVQNLLLESLDGKLDKFVKVQINGKNYKRRVYEDKTLGLYILVNNTKIMEYDICDPCQEY